MSKTKKTHTRKLCKASRHSWETPGSPILDIPGAALSDRGIAVVAAGALERLGSSEQTRGFWIHLDADVINPTVMAAVDSPEPGGPTIKELADLLSPLVCHPRALGLELTIYDPRT